MCCAVLIVLCCTDVMITCNNGATDIAQNDAAANAFADYCSGAHWGINCVSTSIYIAGGILKFPVE